MAKETDLATRWRKEFERAKKRQVNFGMALAKKPADSPILLCSITKSPEGLLRNVKSEGSNKAVSGVFQFDDAAFRFYCLTDPPTGMLRAVRKFAKKYGVSTRIRFIKPDGSDQVEEEDVSEEPSTSDASVQEPSEAALLTRKFRDISRDLVPKLSPEKKRNAELVRERFVQVAQKVPPDLKPMKIMLRTLVTLCREDGLISPEEAAEHADQLRDETDGLNAMLEEFFELRNAAVRRLMRNPDRLQAICDAIEQAATSRPPDMAGVREAYAALQQLRPDIEASIQAAQAEAELQERLCQEFDTLMGIYQASPKIVQLEAAFAQCNSGFGELRMSVPFDAERAQGYIDWLTGLLEETTKRSVFLTEWNKTHEELFKERFELDDAFRQIFVDTFQTVSALETTYPMDVDCAQELLNGLKEYCKLLNENDLQGQKQYRSLRSVVLKNMGVNAEKSAAIAALDQRMKAAVAAQDTVEMAAIVSEMGVMAGQDTAPFPQREAPQNAPERAKLAAALSGLTGVMEAAIAQDPARQESIEDEIEAFNAATSAEPPDLDEARAVLQRLQQDLLQGAPIAQITSETLVEAKAIWQATISETSAQLQLVKSAIAGACAEDPGGIKASRALDQVFQELTQKADRLDLALDASISAPDSHARHLTAASVRAQLFQLRNWVSDHPILSQLDGNPFSADAPNVALLDGILATDGYLR